jgi:putative toxin-antitoxin system antitoxin component (TIGR02293 family)
MTAIQKVEQELNAKFTAFLKANVIDAPNKVTYDAFLEDKMLIIAVIRAGIPFTLFEIIQTITPFSESDWAVILDVSTKSLQRYKAADNHHFKSSHSEKIIEIAEVTKVGLDVFGNADKLKLWLNTPNFALGNLKPIELLRNSYGKELVMSELIRINHGILV